MTTHVRS